MNKYLLITAAVGGLMFMAAPASATPPVPSTLEVKPAVETVHYRRYRYRHRHYGYRYYGPRYYGYGFYPRYGYYGFYGHPRFMDRPSVGFGIGPVGFYW